MRKITSLILIITVVLALLPHTVLASSSGASSIDTTKRGWIEEMKTSDRGPFARIRWFCNDGVILPPKAYACVPHGGGSQHGEWTKRTKELRAKGYFVANFLADLDIEALVKRSNYRDEYNQILIEQFLITANDGWILRKARYYRGALQEESERKGAVKLLTTLAADKEWIKQRYVQLRTGARLLPHGAETKSVTEVRQLSASLSDRDAGFQKIRNKIHVRPEPSDSKLVRDYIPKTKKPQLVEDFKRLAKIIDEVYTSLAAPKLLGKLASRAKTNKALASLARDGTKELGNVKTPEQRFLLTARLMAGLRNHYADPSLAARLRLLLLDASLALEVEHFAAATQLREQLGKATRQQQASWLIASADAIYGSGLITARQHAALKETSKALGGKKISLRDYKGSLDYFGLVPGWGNRQLEYYFQSSMHKLARIEPVAELFIQDQLRASPLFFYAQALDNLLQDANHLAGVRNELFGKDVGAGLRSLNPGIAHGTIEIAKGNDVSDFKATGIYLLPETISELPPVAGILTQGEGNPLSHVQLLARNLGIPNVAVDESLIPKLKALQGKLAIMAVSPAGSVRLSEDKGEWEKLFGKENTKDDVLIRPDMEKLNLKDHKLIRLSQLRASDSGRLVGPKAAKLGELQHQYPEAVADGLAIPFGVFRQMLDQPYNKKQSVFEWMVEQYRSFEAMPEGAKHTAATDAFRKQLYDWILNADPGKAFRDRLRKDMKDTFGKDGSYGVFVRSDTNVEDLGGFTGAGLNLTVVNVVGVDKVIAAISRVWASPFTARSFAWRQALMSQPEHVYPAVLLLRSVNAEKSGVLVTQHIDTGHSGWLSVAINEGVGGAVDGQAAESLRINTTTGEVKLLAQATATIRRSINPKGGIDKLPVSGSDVVLNESDVKLLITLAKELPKRFPDIVDAKGNPAPADIEFGFLKGKLQLFQIRPFLESQRAKGGSYLKSLDSGLKDLDSVKVKMTERPKENS